MPRGEDNSLVQVARRKHKLCRKQERIVLSIVKSTGHDPPLMHVVTI
jgi:hypothetical protein